MASECIKVCAEEVRWGHAVSLMRLLKHLNHRACHRITTVLDPIEIGKLVDLLSEEEIDDPVAPHQVILFDMDRTIVLWEPREQDRHARSRFITPLAVLPEAG